LPMLGTGSRYFDVVVLRGADQLPSALDLWLMRHSTFVLAVGLGLGVLGVIVAATARTHGEDAGLLEWVLYLPSLLLISMAGRATRMSKR
jgi:hypothetical protein